MDVLILQALPSSWQAWYNGIMAQGNPLSKDFLLMNPFHVLAIAAGYLVLVFLGKKAMEQRKAFELRAFSALHNIFLVVLSTYMCYQNLSQAYHLGFSVWGNGVGTTAAHQGVS